MTLPRFPALSETNNLGDLLKYEAPNLYSRDLLPIAAGQVLELGAVIGVSASTGQAKAVDPSATDGSQFAAGVLLQGVDASASTPSSTSTSAAVKGIAVVRHAILADHALVWPTGITVTEKLTAIQQLQNLGVLVRKGI